ncbi:hypothetical protein FEM48_Zijuj06G0035900 [Ziziphus jujuba var. spinosa]|uniref:Transcription factor MYC/MYB N-terminal domain-containing protein n=1 Tax=Ziziphus jujuba var. spinosa TaxID=714518 RepID=A0A978V6X9_ZIZJJ|nr:hypothetical protein FEM48_Zijuj06G0035900 [Ziziphus jujuba var. spinosa]
MESGLPMLNCLLQHTLRTLCSYSDSSNSSKWVYAVFWRILPRNYPPPKWDYGGGALDRSKGNKRNWILVWEDGFCDSFECEQAGNGYIKGRFGADVFFKMSHEVYNYGEGLVGKVAADNSHKWVFRDTSNEGDPGFISSWNVSIEPQPRAWDFQFKSGIQTIAIISIVEDLNLVISIQRKFSYLQSIPGVFAMQRPYLPIQHPYILKPNNQIIETHEAAALSVYEKRQLTGMKRLFSEVGDDSPIKSINLGWNAPQNGTGTAGSPIWSIPPLLPSMSCSLGALLTKLPSVVPSYSNIDTRDTAMLVANNSNNSTGQIMKINNNGGNVKVESSCHFDAAEEKMRCPSLNPNVGREVGSGFGPSREGETQSQSDALKLN